jgi:uncharacterized metal-binding protein
MGECCGDGKRTVLVYACSGGANVGEVADRAARGLMGEGCGTMFCMAGLGADIEGMVATARGADVNLVIDGCEVDCAKKIFERHGIANYRQVKVTDLGIEKVKGEGATEEQVAKTVARAKDVLSEA